MLLEHVVVWMILGANDEGVALEGISRIKRARNAHPHIGQGCSTATGSMIDMGEEMGVDHDELRSIQTARS